MPRHLGRRSMSAMTFQLSWQAQYLKEASKLSFSWHVCFLQDTIHSMASGIENTHNVGQRAVIQFLKADQSTSIAWCRRCMMTNMYRGTATYWARTFREAREKKKYLPRPNQAPGRQSSGMRVWMCTLTSSTEPSWILASSCTVVLRLIPPHLLVYLFVRLNRAT